MIEPQAREETKSQPQSFHLKNLHFSRCGDLNFEEYGEDIDVLNLGNGIAMDSTVWQFREIFFQLLNYQYGHLSENDLFDSVDESATSSTDNDHDNNCIVLKDFEGINLCSKEQNYLDFFSVHFKSCPKENVHELLGSFSKLHRDKKNIMEAEDFHRLIIECVTAFCLYIIESRVGAMELLEKFEADLYEKTISYDFIVKPVDDHKRHRISTLISQIEALKKLYERYNKVCKEYSDAKHQLYLSQLSLCEEILSFINEELGLLDKQQELIEYIKSSKNHYSYLQEYLNDLPALFLPILKRYTISSKYEDGHRILDVKMVAGTFACVKAVINQYLCFSSLETGDLIRLYADSVIYADTELIFPGVSFACISPKIVKKKHDQIYISTDALVLSESNITGPALSGRSGNYSLKKGQAGSDGANGRYGNPGGNIMIISSCLKPGNWCLTADGSCGEDGQTGGNGGSGWTPSREGQDGVECDFEQDRTFFRYDYDSVLINYGTLGENGGQGGDAGMGGAAGKSGISGKIQLIDLENSKNCMETQTKIKDGQSGNPGKPGSAGKHTRQGRDYGAYARKHGFWKSVFSRRDKRKKSKIWGELTHPSIPDARGSGRCIERKCSSLPHQQKSESHPDFTIGYRGENCDGKRSQIKVNHNIANENKLIDKCACFHSIKVQYQKSLQHWNAASHTKFLNAFACKIGESLDEDFTKLKHSDIIKKRVMFGRAVFILNLKIFKRNLNSKPLPKCKEHKFSS